MIDVMLFIINLDFFFVSYYVFFCLFFIIFFFLLFFYFVFFFFFFFQAEDGIRDLYVTGVQTCALPISFPSKFWNAIAAFVILGIVSESFSFTIPVANVRTSVSFVAFIASVALFQDRKSVV